MPADITIAAMIVTVLALTIYSGVLIQRAPKDERLFLGMLVLLMLPMNALAFHLVRMPLDAWLASALGEQNEIYHVLKRLYAPVTEEPAKLWLLLIPCCYYRLKSLPVHRSALAIGLGFGVGEAWTVACLLAKSPEIAQYPWYMLNGYIGERLMVCIMHAAFTAAALYFIVKHRQVAGGLLSCMALHLLGNLPIFLAEKNSFGLGKNVWAMLLQLWVLLYFVAMGILLAYIAYGNRWFQKLIRGKVRCPECGQLYTHPLLGFSLLHKNYERCPHCRHWHLVSAFDEEDQQASPPHAADK
ncbi:MAG: hypothetical protein PHT80_03275 [Lentisphaeria bacterium]|nr:hypothetical protein [Lentisphaeria bacterium]